MWGKISKALMLVFQQMWSIVILYSILYSSNQKSQLLMYTLVYEIQTYLTEMLIKFCSWDLKLECEYMIILNSIIKQWIEICHTPYTKKNGKDNYMKMVKIKEFVGYSKLKFCWCHHGEHDICTCMTGFRKMLQKNAHKFSLKGQTIILPAPFSYKYPSHFFCMPNFIIIELQDIN